MQKRIHVRLRRVSVGWASLDVSKLQQLRFLWRNSGRTGLATNGTIHHSQYEYPFRCTFLRSILLTSPPSTGFASKIYTLQLECFDILSSDFPLNTGISFQMIVIFNLRRIQFRLETATPSVLFSVIFDIFFVSLVIQIRLAQIFVFFLLNKNSITSLECFCNYKAQFFLNNSSNKNH